MRAVVQRVSGSSVLVDGEPVGEIASGLVVLLGVASGDTEADVGVMAGKIAGLRILPDAEGKMNLSVSEAGGSVLLVSQFTLLADVRRGRRPSFTEAAPPGEAASLVERVAVAIRDAGIPCETGRFGAHMEVELVNDGPVTIVIDVIGGRVV